MDRSTGELDRLTNEFRCERSVGIAADLMGVAYTVGKPEVARDAVKYLNQQKQLPILARKIASLCLDEEMSGRWDILPLPRDYIRWFRRELTSQARAPFSWCDLALAYASLGRYDKARRALQVAQSLAPQNRFILRSVVRLEHHTHNLDKALAILRRDPARLRDDPWLLAVDLALVDLLENKQTYANVARKVLKEDIAPLHLAELSASLGTVELANGSRHARKLFRNSLQDPTDVAVAQVVWSHEKDSAIPMPTQDALQISSEGQAKSEYVAGHWLASVDAAEKWLSEEPFATSAALHGSAVAPLFEDYGRAIKFAETGLKANSNDASLLNNLAYVYAEQSLIELATETLDRINMSSSDETSSRASCVLATRGLIKFRAGDCNQGREYYLKAIECAEKSNDLSLQAKASAFLARESCIAGVATTDEDCVRARKFLVEIRKSNLPDKMEIEHISAAYMDGSHLTAGNVA